MAKTFYYSVVKFVPHRLYYSVVKFVPHPERDEAFNIGVAVVSESEDYAEVVFNRRYRAKLKAIARMSAIKLSSGSSRVSSLGSLQPASPCGCLEGTK